MTPDLPENAIESFEQEPVETMRDSLIEEAYAIAVIASLEGHGERHVLDRRAVARIIDHALLATSRCSCYTPPPFHFAECSEFGNT